MTIDYDNPEVTARVQANPEFQAHLDATNNRDFFNILSNEFGRRGIMFLGFGMRQVDERGAEAYYLSMTPGDLSKLPIDYQFTVWGHLASHVMGSNGEVRADIRSIANLHTGEVVPEENVLEGEYVDISDVTPPPASEGTGADAQGQA